MSKRENEPKTALGARIRAIRKELGDEDRAVFASKLGISKNTLAYYERGERTPDAAVLAVYHRRFGINVTWLVTGVGAMFDDPSKAPAPAVAVDPELMERLYKEVDRVYRDRGRKQPAHFIANEAASLFNALLSRIADIRDKPMVDAAIDVVVDELGKTLDQEAAESASSKRLA